MQINTLLQSPSVLSDEQVLACGSGTIENCVCAVTHKEGANEVAVLCYLVEILTSESQMTCWKGKGLQSRSRTSKLTIFFSFFLYHFQRVVWAFSLFTFLHKLGAWFTLWEQAAVIFSAYKPNLEFSWEVTILHGVWLFIASSFCSLRGSWNRRKTVFVIILLKDSVWLTAVCSVWRKPWREPLLWKHLLQDKPKRRKNPTCSYKQWCPTTNN